MNMEKVHQIALVVCGILTSIIGIYRFIDGFYSFETFRLFRSTITYIVLTLFLICFGVVLILVSFWGKKEILSWFGMLKSYRGTGLYLLFIGFWILGASDTFGFISALFVLSTSIFSFILSKSNAERDYPPFLG